MTRLLPLFFCLFLFSRCDVINPEEEVPAYIYIDTFHLITEYSEQGSNSTNISDAWVYVNNELVTVDELPAMIPVLRQGQQEVLVFGGIKNNGISSTRMAYPFYRAFDTTLSLQANTIDTITPVLEYLDDLNFPLKNDFEAGHSFQNMTVTNDPALVFEGNRSGMVVLDDVNSSFGAASNQLNLPGLGTRVYLEFDYRNTESFQVSLRVFNLAEGNSYSVPILTLTPQSEWNKVYVDLTTAVSTNSGDNYQLVFSGSKPDAVSAAAFYWDNIKIVHF